MNVISKPWPKKSLNTIFSKLMYCLIIYSYKVYHAEVHSSLLTECCTCNPKRRVVFESIPCMFEGLNKIVDVLKSHHCGLWWRSFLILSWVLWADFDSSKVSSQFLSCKILLKRFNPFAPGDFAEKRVLKPVEWFSGHCRAIKS